MDAVNGAEAAGEANLVAELRATVAALMAQVAALTAQVATLTARCDEYQHLNQTLQAELDRLRDEKKTPREHVAAGQIQLAFAACEEPLLQPAAAAAPTGLDATANPPASPPDKKKPPKRDNHGRGVLPEHLPVQTLVIKPASVADWATVVGEEVSWRLGFKPAGFVRLKIVRPTYVVGKDDAPVDDRTTTQLFEGDVSMTRTAGAANDEVATSASAMPAEGTSPAVPSGLVAVATVTSAAPASARAQTTRLASDVAPPLAVEAPASGSRARTTLVCAPAPDEMIPRGVPTPDLLARIITGKFADKLPFARQYGIFARAQVRVTRGTMCGWVEQAHDLAKRVVKAMSDEAIAKAHFIATDATGVLVQASERCKNGHFWVFIADRDHVFFRYSPRHSSDEPLTFFKDFRGIVLADASSVYDALYKLPKGPDEAGCNSHARRYFFKAITSDATRAHVGIGFFNRLFELERAFADLAPAERLRRRQLESAPVVAQLDAWRKKQLTCPQVATGTPIRKALNYLANHWDALTHFLRDGHIPIHNNWSELNLRSLVVGRHNWLFVGNDASAEWTCTFVSLVASCQLHGLDPEAYLRDLFRVLPAWPRPRVLELAPKYWRATRDRLDPAELAMPLGDISIPPPLEPVPAQQPAEDPRAQQVCLVGLAHRG